MDPRALPGRGRAGPVSLEGKLQESWAVVGGMPQLPGGCVHRWDMYLVTLTGQSGMEG